MITTHTNNNSTSLQKNQMNFLSSLLVLLILGSSFTLQLTASFLLNSNSAFKTSRKMNSQGCDMSGHPSTLPGDPSLNLVTNVDLGDKKLEVMKGKYFSSYFRSILG
jgi:hypothetical protein